MRLAVIFNVAPSLLPGSRASFFSYLPGLGRNVRYLHRSPRLSQELILPRTKASAVSAAEERNFIVQLMQNVPNPRDVRQYLKVYKEGRQFAIVKIQDGSITFDEPGAKKTTSDGDSASAFDVRSLAASLFRLQRLGLHPIVIMDNPLQCIHARHQSSDTMHDSKSNHDGHIHVHVRNGHNTSETPRATMEITSTSRQVLMRRCLDIVDAIDDAGGRATPILDSVFLMDESAVSGPAVRCSDSIPLSMNASSSSQFGSCVRSKPQMAPAHLDMDSLASAINMGHIPVVAPIVETDNGQRFHLDIDVATYTLGKLLKPIKTIVISADGGIVHPVTKQVIHSVNLEEEYGNLVDKFSLARASSVAYSPQSHLQQANNHLQPQVRNHANLTLMRLLLAELPPTAWGIVTAPSSLMTHAFSTKVASSGTMIRHGMHISVHDRWDAIDLDKLKNLLEDAFGKDLDDKYWQQTHDRLRWIYVAGDYEGVAIITTEGGVPYLDKFAVAHSAQGQGIGEILWSYIRRDNQDLFWRSRADNVVNSWYFEHSDGNYRAGKWTVFWYGLKSFDMMQFYAECATRLPATMHQKIHMK